MVPVFQFRFITNMCTYDRNDFSYNCILFEKYGLCHFLYPNCEAINC